MLSLSGGAVTPMIALPHYRPIEHVVRRQRQ